MRDPRTIFASNEDAIAALLHMQVRAARIMAMMCLGLAVLSVPAIVLTAQWFWAFVHVWHDVAPGLSLFVITFAGVGGLASLGGLLYALYMRVAGKVFVEYVTEGMRERVEVSRSG